MLIRSNICRWVSVELPRYRSNSFSSASTRAFTGQSPALHFSGINLVITKDLSRLGRNYIMCGQYTEIYFPERHVRYIALNDGVDTLNQTSSMDITPFKHILKNTRHLGGVNC